MSEDHGGAATGVMAGGGFYDTHSRTQQGAAAIGLAALDAAVAELDLAAGRLVTVADLGAAQGHNSLAPMRELVGRLRARGAGPVDVVHTDLPGNDWTTLFDVVEHDPASYLSGQGDVHPFVVGRSFYERLFPAGALDVAWCASALHWLNAAPGGIGDHFFVHRSSDEQARAAYRAASAADWTTFLGHRAGELRESGSVVIVDVLTDDEGLMGGEALFDALERELRAARESGAITAAEYPKIVYPTWFRSLDELRAPFAPEFVAASGARLALASLEPAFLADPFRPAFERDGDAAAYGTAQAGFLRGFLGPSFRAALDGPDARRDAVLDAVFARTAERVAADPVAFSPTYRLVCARVRRVG